MPDKTLANAKALKPFKRPRFPLSLKLEAVRVWLAGASLRKTAWSLKDQAVFSHEAVRQWSHRLRHLFRPKMVKRRLVVVDETSIHLANGREVFGWAALDGDTKEVLLTWITQGRSSLEALLFMKNVVRRCRGDPFVMVDRGVWYPWALDTLDLEWKVQRGAARNHVECFFGTVKHRLAGMRRRPGTWHTLASIQPLMDMLGWAWNDQVAAA